MCEALLEFPEGWGGGVLEKIPSVGEVWIFSRTTCTHYDYIKQRPGSTANCLKKVSNQNKCKSHNIKSFSISICNFQRMPQKGVKRKK